MFYLKWIRLDQGAALSVLLLKFRLVRLEHADLAPPIEEQGDSGHPQHQHEDDDQGLLRANYYRTCFCDLCNQTRSEVDSRITRKEQP